MTSTPLSSRAAAVARVSPIPPARFSPLAVTRSAPRSSRRPGRWRSSTWRPGLPMTSPIMSTRSVPALGRGGRDGSWSAARVRPFSRRVTVAPVPVPGKPPEGGSSLGVLHRARLADDRHLDLAWIRQRLLDLAHDVTGEAPGGQVVDLFGPDEDPDLTTGLHRERLLHAGEGVGDGLQVGEALQVGIHGLAAGTGPRC